MSGPVLRTKRTLSSDGFHESIYGTYEEKLSLSSVAGQARNVHFTFYPDRDTAPSVANEMVEQLDLVEHDAPYIAEIINNFITKILPGWKPSSAYCSPERSNTHVSPPSKQPSSGCLSDRATNTHDSSPSKTGVPASTNMAKPSGDDKQSEHGSPIDKDLETSLGSEPGSFVGSEASFADLNVEVPKSRGVSCNGSFLSLCERDKVKARIELQVIETRYKQWCKEMKRVMKKGVRATRKRCLPSL